MKICKRCILPDTFPGLRLDRNGVCNFCAEFEKEADFENKKKRFRKRFEELLKKHKGKRSYDGLMSYSGGKDSTYTLSILRERYGLSLLAFTLDNGFLPEQTFKNIRQVTEKLEIDHIFFKPRFDLLKKIFIESSQKNIYSQASLTRASTICTSCMAIVKFSSLRLALEKNIPFLIFGWSPGQIPISSSIMKNNPSMVRVMQNAILKPLIELIGDEIKPYFLEERHFQAGAFFPYNISPLAFLDYDEEKIRERVAQFGWKNPLGVDANSTNCLLNSFANIIHKNMYGFHPYAFELAKLVREGYLERSAALEKLDQQESRKTVNSVKKKLYS